MTIMTIRKLEPDEYYDADMISRTCFHERFHGDEAQDHEKPREAREDWGAFDGDGMMAAHIINNHFRANLNGSIVTMGGIGAVSTLPEYRGSGSIRQIFDRLLPEAYARGEVISGLYPFKHAFYRKFGYETVAPCTSYTLKPASLREFLPVGEIKQYTAGQDAKEYIDAHNRFAREYNLSIIRNEKEMRCFLCDRALAERKFSYMLCYSGKDPSYLCFTDQFAEPAARLAVNDIAWNEPLQLHSLLGFLGRFEADYGLIELNLPTDINLKLLIPDPYEISEAKLMDNYMLRVINVEEALKTLCSEVRESFTIAVYGDKQILQNNGAWRVNAEGVAFCSGMPDLEVSLHAFNQLICGAMSFSQALYRSDVRVNANAVTLAEIFKSRPIFITDRF